MSKLYLVQCWDDTGALKNHYNAQIESPAELKHLKKFLRETCAHVQIVPVAKAKAKPAKRK